MASVLKIGVVGAGQVGVALGSKLAKKGHQIKYGSRDPNSGKVKELLAKESYATADTITNTVSWADAVLVTTPGSPDPAGYQALGASLGDGVSGKLVIDVTNPLTAWPALELPWGNPKSGAEYLAEAIPTAAVFKAFNTVGVELMLDPSLPGQTATMLYAGDGTDAQLAAATQIVADVGFIPEYCGALRYARNLEAIAELWIHLGVPPCHQGRPVHIGRAFQFQLIGKQ